MTIILFVFLVTKVYKNSLYEAGLPGNSSPATAALGSELLTRPVQPDTLRTHPQPDLISRLTEADYLLSLPVEPGWVVTVWQNQQAIFSKIIADQNQVGIPVALEFGTNRIRIGAWDQHQRLVLDDYREIRYHHPELERLRFPVVRGNSNLPLLALTFDGGAEAGQADSILSILRKNNLTTTLFLTGQFVEKYPLLVQQMVEDGHEIGNHTYNHPHLTTYEENRQHLTAPGISRVIIKKQLRQTDSLFHKLTGRHMAPYWRAPYGEYNQEILDWAAQAGYRHIGWTPGFDTFDWVSDTTSPIYRTPAEIYRQILGKDSTPGALSGTIILMHLGTHRPARPVYTILDSLIGALQERKYRWAPISKLINQ